jgi:hypothetical protein
LGNEISIHRGEREPNGRAELFVVKGLVWNAEATALGALERATGLSFPVKMMTRVEGGFAMRHVFSGSAASAAPGARVSSAAAACQSLAGLAATNWLGSLLGWLSTTN